MTSFEILILALVFFVLGGLAGGWVVVFILSVADNLADEKARRMMRGTPYEKQIPPKI